MPDTQIREITFIGERFKAADGGMMAKGGGVEKFNEGDKFYDTQEQRLVEIKNVRKDGVIEFHSITEDNDFYLSNSLLKKVLNSGVWFKILDELGMGLKAKGGKMAKGGMTRKGGQSFEVNSRKFFYHKDDGNVYDSNHRLYAGSYDTLEQAKKSLEKNFEDIKKGTFFKEGGKVKFADKVKAVQESLLKRKKVAPQVQKDYGKTYSKAEAKESAQRIVGSRMAQLKEKMAKKKK